MTLARTVPLLSLFLCLVAPAAASSTNTLCINVNFDGTPQTGLEGPAGVLGSSWNHILTSPVTATNLLDSAGIPSTMGFICTAEFVDSWHNEPQFAMLTSAALNFGWATPYQLVINGLDPSKKYDLYIAGYYPNENGSIGWYTTTNQTASPRSQRINNGGWGGNDDLWIEGTNYIRFVDIIPTIGSNITIDIVGTNGCRAMVSGFQLVDLNITPEAFIWSFGLSGMWAVINQTATNVAWTVPHGTDVTTLAPEYMLTAGATCDKASGSTQNFTTPQTYQVVSADGRRTNAYIVTVTVTPISTPKDILTFGPGAVINGSLISWRVPYGTDVMNLAPTYTVSAFATGDPVSGTARDFTTPQIYTVTAEDLSTKQYVVIVSVSPAPWINVNVGPELQTDLVGPVGGSGATWNSIYSVGTDITNALDYAGNPTPVRIVLPKMGGSHFVDAWPNPPELAMLRGASAQFSWNDQFLLYLYGLDTAKKYDLYIGSYYANENGSKGMFWTDNATSSSSTNYIDNGGYQANNDTYVEGSNFIRFTDMVPDGSSNITIRMVGLGGCRAMLCGFQLVDLGQVPCVNITNIEGTIDVPLGTTTQYIAGTNNVYTVGMSWTNVGNNTGGNITPGIWNFTANLAIGNNVITVKGTNNAGDVSIATVTIMRGGTPYVNITNAPVTVANGVTTYTVAGTNNAYVVGTMWVTNATAGGARQTFAAAFSWTAPAVSLVVGANTIVVYGSNALNDTMNDSVTIIRGGLGTGSPFIDVTNTDETVSYDIATFTIGGTNNQHVAGRLSWTNSLTGESGTLPASAAWTISNIGLGVGVNVITVSGTNLWNLQASDSLNITRGTVGAGVPFVDVTNATATIPNDVTGYAVAGTNNLHVVGGMLASNATAGGVARAFPASNGWTSPLVPLALGGNLLVVSGTNTFGIEASDFVIVSRGPVGTGTPFVDVTNMASWVANDVPGFVVAGTNNVQVVGGMWASNDTTGGASVEFPAGARWTSPMVPVALGANLIYVHGTNSTGTKATDFVIVTRGPAGTGRPFVDCDVSNDPLVVEAPTNIVFTGTNNLQVVGDMWITSSATTQTVVFAAAHVWTSLAVNIELYTNIVNVFGTNVFGVATNDTVMVIGVPEPVIGLMLGMFLALRRLGRR